MKAACRHRPANPSGCANAKNHLRNVLRQPMSRVARVRMRPVPMVTAPKRANSRPGGRSAYYPYRCHCQSLPHGHTYVLATPNDRKSSISSYFSLLGAMLRLRNYFRLFFEKGIEVANRTSSLRIAKFKLKRIVSGEFEGSVCFRVWNSKEFLGS